MNKKQTTFGQPESKKKVQKPVMTMSMAHSDKFAMQDQLACKLRAHYNQVLNEEVPEQLHQLLKELEAKSK